MEVGDYELESAGRIEPSLGATFVGKRDRLLVARAGRGGKYELEVLRPGSFKSLKRGAVADVASLMRVGEKHLLLRLPVSIPDDEDEAVTQSFEVRALSDFRVVSGFEEQAPGHAAAHPAGGRIAVAHDFGGLHVRDARTGEVVATYASKGVGGVAYSPDGRLLAAKEFAGALKFFDADAEGQLKPLRSVAVGRETAIAFHPSEPLVAAADRQAIKIVDAGAAKVRAAIKVTKREHAGTVKHIAYSPDGRLLVTGTRGGNFVGLWDLERGAFAGHLCETAEPLTGVEFDAKGKYLLVSSYDAAELYSVAKA